MAWSRVELFEQIRRDRRVERLSIRELADRYRVHRRTVRQAVASAVPPPRKRYPRRARPANVRGLRANEAAGTPSGTSPDPRVSGKTGRRRGPLRIAVRHFVEMVIAMVAGMVLLDPVWTASASVVGGTQLLARPDVAAVVMATNMTVAMAIWMRHRRHGWARIAEMGAAMYVPYLLLLVPYWAGIVSGEAMQMGGHVLMLAAMVAAMLLRRTEYTRDHRDHLVRGSR